MTRILARRDVERLLPMAECIEVVAAALAATSLGDALVPLRQAVWMPDRTGMIGLMPGWLGEPAALGLKVVSIFPGNHGTALDSHQGIVMLVDTRDGTPLAIVDAASITAIRTAAASAVATRALARPDAGDLAILGAGVQAASHVEAMRAVRSIRRIRVWSRTAEHARAFAAAHGAEAVATPRDAVAGADLICTTTAAKTPILEGAWLADGAHVNAVGACFASARELDADAVTRAYVIVDRRESALAESGDLLLAHATDRIAGELGEVLLGRVAGRTAPSQITLFESLGIAVEDLAAAHHVYRRALATDTGVEVQL